MENAKVRRLIALAEEAGAYGAAYVPVDRIVLSQEFRQICQRNSCGRYGRCYMCPPDLGEIGELMEKIRSYTHAVVYQSVAPLEDSFDFEGMMEAGDAHARLSARIHRQLEGEFLHLSGGCRRCQRCAKLDNLPCRNPDVALGAMEGYGVDVYQTVKDTKLKYINGENTVTYFGMILFGE